MVRQLPQLRNVQRSFDLSALRELFF
jgi:hypothetical protein